MTTTITASTSPTLLEWNPATGFSPLDPAYLFPTGLLYGYSVFTTFRTPISETSLKMHLTRLSADCEALGLGCPSGEAIRQALLQTALFHEAAQVIRLTVFADISDWTVLADPHATPLNSRLLCAARPVAETTAPTVGLRLVTTPFEKPMPTIKHGSLVAVLPQLRQAKRQGADDVLWVNRHGHVTESTTANVFVLKHKTLCTPHPLRDGCLPGVTRQQVLDAAQAIGLPCSDEPVFIDEMADWDGIFLSNAVQGLQRVAQIEDTCFPWPDWACQILEQLQQAIQPHPHTAGPR